MDSSVVVFVLGGPGQAPLLVTTAWRQCQKYSCNMFYVQDWQGNSLQPPKEQVWMGAFEHWRPLPSGGAARDGAGMDQRRIPWCTLSSIPAQHLEISNCGAVATCVDWRPEVELRRRAGSLQHHRQHKLPVT